MFILERRPVGGKTWRQRFEGYYLTVNIFKDNIDHKPEFSGINVKDYEWRIREIKYPKVGKKVL